MELMDGAVEHLLKKKLGIQCVESRYVKMTLLMIEEYKDKNHDICLEIIALHVEHLEIWGLCSQMRIM